MKNLWTIYRLLRKHMGRVEAVRNVPRWARELAI
jgi:hypothetical protein